MYHKHLFDLLPDKGCSVCLEQMQHTDSTMLICGHIFHSACIQFNNCPMCRQTAMTWESTESLRFARQEIMRLQAYIDSIVDNYVQCSQDNLLLRENLKMKSEMVKLALAGGKIDEASVKGLIEKYTADGNYSWNPTTNQLVALTDSHRQISNSNEHTFYTLMELLNIFENQ